MHLVLGCVQFFADGGHQLAETLQRLLVFIFQEFDHTAVYDVCRQHLELEELADQLHVS